MNISHYNNFIKLCDTLILENTNLYTLHIINDKVKYIYLYLLNNITSVAGYTITHINTGIVIKMNNVDVNWNNDVSIQKKTLNQLYATCTHCDPVYTNDIINLTNTHATIHVPQGNFNNYVIHTSTTLCPFIVTLNPATFIDCCNIARGKKDISFNNKPNYYRYTKKELIINMFNGKFNMKYDGVDSCYPIKSFYGCIDKQYHDSKCDNKIDINTTCCYDVPDKYTSNVKYVIDKFREHFVKQFNDDVMVLFNSLTCAEELTNRLNEYNDTHKNKQINVDRCLGIITLKSHIEVEFDKLTNDNTWVIHDTNYYAHTQNSTKRFIIFINENKTNAFCVNIEKIKQDHKNIPEDNFCFVLVDNTVYVYNKHIFIHNMPTSNIFVCTLEGNIELGWLVDTVWKTVYPYENAMTISRSNLEYKICNFIPDTHISTHMNTPDFKISRLKNCLETGDIMIATDGNHYIFCGLRYIKKTYKKINIL